MSQLTAGLIVVIGILGGFYFGAKYGQGHPAPTSSPVASTNAGGAGGTGRGGFVGGGGTGTGGTGTFTPAAAGTITAVNGNIITVMDRTTGKSVKVDVASARISKTDTASASDLTQNTVVTVIGQTGSDGTVTAQTISIGGAGAGAGAGAGGGRRQPSPAPST